jgi:hypothetical protein
MNGKYDEASFWAGVTVGTQLHGKGAYGVMPGWTPDAELVLRPITQGVPVIRFGAYKPFTIPAMTDTVDEAAPFPELDRTGITESVPVITFEYRPFTVLALSEEVTAEESSL